MSEVVPVAWTEWAAAAAAAAAVLSAAASALVVILNARHKNQQEAGVARQQSLATALEEYRQIVDRQEQQIGRLEVHAGEQLVVIHRLQALHSECREETAEVWGHLRLMHDLASRMALRLDPPETVPEMPTRPRRDRQEEGAFLVRQSEQSEGALRKVRPEVPREAEGAGGG